MLRPPAFLPELTSGDIALVIEHLLTPILLHGLRVRGLAGTIEDSAELADELRASLKRLKNAAQLIAEAEAKVARGEIDEPKIPDALDVVRAFIGTLWGHCADHREIEIAVLWCAENIDGFVHALAEGRAAGSAQARWHWAVP